MILADEKQEALPRQSDAQNLATLLLIRDLRAKTTFEDEDAKQRRLDAMNEDREEHQCEEARRRRDQARIRRADSMRILAEKKQVRSSNTYAMRTTQSANKYSAGWEKGVFFSHFSRAS